MFGGEFDDGFGARLHRFHRNGTDIDVNYTNHQHFLDEHPGYTDLAKKPTGIKILVDLANKMGLKQYPEEQLHFRYKGK